MKKPKFKTEHQEYISLTEASKLSDFSRSYLNVLIRRGKLKAIKRGKDWFTTYTWLFEYQAPKEIAQKKYISLGEAAKLLNTTTGYLNVLVDRGKLRAIKLGRNWVTAREWLNEYQKSVGRIAQDFDVLKLDARPFLTEREKQLRTEALIPEIKLSSRELKLEEKSKIFKAVEERFKSADISEFQNVSKQLGILKSLKSWSHFKFYLASSLIVILLAVSLGISSELINFPNFKLQVPSSKFRASIFSDVLKNFSGDLPSFSRWFTLSLSKGLAYSK